MPDARYLMGLDCGHSVVKASLIDAATGREVATAQASFDGIEPRPGWMEYDPEALWRTACAAVRGALAKSNLPAGAVAAISPTGAGNGLLMLDERDRPVGNGIYAIDTRCADMIRTDAATDFPARTRAINGQSAWTGQTVSLLKWFSLHEPGALSRAARIFAIKDYIKYRLTGGAYVSDYSEQSKLGLLDIRRRETTAELLGLYGLDHLAGRLPALGPSTQVAGEVSRAAAEATSLRAGTPVINGVSDIDACALGAGVVEAGQLSVVAGTWSINQLILDKPVFDDRLFGLSHYVVDGLYEELEASPSSAANLNWFIEQACGDWRRAAGEQGGSVYDRVNEAVAGVEPATTPVFFHPYLYGSNTMLNARAGFYGLAGWHDRSELLAALFEGVVFSHNDHVEKLKGLGMPVREVRLSGGAARSGVWVQIFADVMKLPVAVPEAGEIGALGAAVCAAVGVGAYPDLPTAAAAMVRIAARYETRREMSERYAVRYDAYRRITRLMGPVWDELEQYAKR